MPHADRDLPPGLSHFIHQHLPEILAAVDPSRALQTVRDIVAHDRWNSFDQFHETNRMLAAAYEACGAQTETHAIPTGGVRGDGKWIIPQAEDIRDATLDLLEPTPRRILDYRQCPWHVVQWSAATPEAGITCELAVVDTEEQLAAASRRALVGKIVLTRLNPQATRAKFCAAGAAGLLFDLLVADCPGAVAWTKFGWGGLDLWDGATPMVGLAISSTTGDELRALHRQSGRLIVRARVDVRAYAGSHDVVSGIIPGRDDPDTEIWAVAHNAEPGALDNASGGAACVEIALAIRALITAGILPPPRRTIRLLHGYECYGFFHYLEHTRRLQPPLAGVCIDTIGARPDLCRGELRWHATAPGSASFVDDIGCSILESALALRPVYRLKQMPFLSTEDTLLGDPKYGYPCPWITNHPAIGYHSSADTIDMVDGAGLAVCTAAMAAYLYYLADMGTDDAREIADWQTEKTLAAIRSRTRAYAPHSAASPITRDTGVPPVPAAYEVESSPLSGIPDRLQCGNDGMPATEADSEGPVINGDREQAMNRASVISIGQQHRMTVERMKRFVWTGEHAVLTREFDVLTDDVSNTVRDLMESRQNYVGRALPAAADPADHSRRAVPALHLPNPQSRENSQSMLVPTPYEKQSSDTIYHRSRLIPIRRRPLSPTMENVSPALSLPNGPHIKQEVDSAFPKWVNFWADGERSLAEIAALAALDAESPLRIEQVIAHFEVLAELRFVDLIDPADFLTEAKLAADFAALGVRAGMDLMIHSSLKSIGPVRGGAAAVVRALLAVLGPDGTLLAPTFNHHEARVFNPLTTPTNDGAIPEAIWRCADALRSLHPSHSVAAIGPRAAEYLRDHLANGVWAANSPIGRLIDSGGHLLSVGVGHDRSTAYHVAEISLNAPCLDQFGSVDRMAMPDGQVQTVAGLAWRAGECPVCPTGIDTLLADRQSHGRIGHAPATLARAADVWSARREQLGDRCRTCPVRPHRRGVAASAEG